MERKMYVAPGLEVLEVMVEKGFAGSVVDSNFPGAGNTPGANEWD